MSKQHIKASQVTLEWLLERLEGVEGSGNSYQAYCPCHDDVGSQHKGLSITVSGKRVLCKCHSPQCRATLTKVIAALEGFSPNGHQGLKVHLKPSGKNGMYWWVTKTGVARSVWEALGVEEFEGGIKFTFSGEAYFKFRKPPKDFGWNQSLGAEAPPFWPYPMDDLPEEISIWEGESDAGTAHAAGLPFAFAVTKGSDTNISEAHFRALASRGVSSVLIGSDTDTPGLDFREEMERAAVDADLDVRVVELEQVIDPFSGGKDLNWVWRNCASREEFLALVERATRDAKEWSPHMTREEISNLLADEEFYYIPDLIAPQDKVMLGGPQKSYKTWMLLDLARSLVACEPFLGRQEWTPKSPVKVLFIEEEGSRRAWARRVHRMGLTPEQFDSFFTWHRWGFTFNSEEAVASVIAYIKQNEIECVIFDPLQRMIPGINENDSTETAIIWDQVMRMQRAIPTLSVVIAHHTRKDAELGFEAFRGSSRHGGETDIGLFCERHPVELDRMRFKVIGREVTAELSPGEVFEGTIKITDDLFKIDTQEFKVAIHARKADANRDSIVAAIREGCETRTEIMRATQLSDNTVLKHLAVLIEAGTVEEERTGDGKSNLYRIAA